MAQAAGRRGIAPLKSGAENVNEAFLRRWHSGRFQTPHGKREEGSSPFSGFVLLNGATYYGGLDEARRPSGPGAYERPEQNFRYKGDFYNGQTSGQGRMEVEGAVAEGMWKEGDLHKGSITLPGGHTFTGTMLDGDWMGPCRVEYASGDVYEGELKSGFPHGQGKWIDITGSVYEGKFQNGQRQGEGTLRHANGDVFSGSFHRGQMNGEGRLVTAGGGALSGEWINGTLTGTGKYACANGVQYHGDLEGGVMHGKGVLSCGPEAVEGGELSSFCYEGRMVRGVPEGDGTLHIGACSLKTTWANGRPHGIGDLGEAPTKLGRPPVPIGKMRYEHGIRDDVFVEARDETEEADNNRDS